MLQSSPSTILTAISRLCALSWEDGAKYPIDHVLDKRRAASLKAGGTGMRYTIRVQGKETYMWLEQERDKHRWFVEARTY